MTSRTYRLKAGLILRIDADVVVFEHEVSGRSVTLNRTAADIDGLVASLQVLRDNIPFDLPGSRSTYA